jgi:Uma2 family endonuclease
MTHHWPDVSEAAPIVVRSEMTADQYFGMEPSRQPQNLIDGLLYLSPAPGEEHEAIVNALVAALREHARSHGGHVIRPRFDCWFDDANVVQPDTGYLVAQRVSLAGRYIHGAPDLLVEVVSPGTRSFDNEAKFALYGKLGVREAWFVDPAAEAVTVVYGDGQAWLEEVTVSFGETIPSRVVEVGAGNLTAGSVRS